MPRRADRWADPAPGGTPPTEPIQVIDLYPNPLPPPPPPLTREASLATIQAGFASLTDDELTLARLWLLGKSVQDVQTRLRLDDKAVGELVRGMRLKLKDALKPKE